MSRIKSRLGKLLVVVGVPMSLWFAFCARYEKQMIHRQTSSTDSVVKTTPTIDQDFDDKAAVVDPSIKAKTAKATRRDNSKESNAKTKVKDEQEEKPLFILHVGPPKTGTTTAQWAAALNEELLLKDDIHYLGHWGGRPEWKLHQLVWACTQGRDEECAQKWSKLDRAVETLFQQNSKSNRTVAFLSEELFSHFKDEQDERDHLWKYLPKILEKWHVRVILTYRRFYDWAPSYYAQLNAPKDKKKTRRWPSEGGRRIPTFAEYFDEVMELHYRRLMTLREKWASRFDDVWVFDMHTEGDYRENFFCQMLPEAQHLCLEFRQNHKAVTKNPSSSKILHHDMVAVEAQSRGWVHPDLTRPQARLAVQEHAKNELKLTSASHYPQACLSKNQTEILVQWSLDLERNMFPDLRIKKSDVAQIVAENRDKYCSVNVHEVLKDTKWKQFFKALGPEKRI